MVAYVVKFSTKRLKGAHGGGADWLVQSANAPNRDSLANLLVCKS